MASARCAGFSVKYDEGHEDKLGQLQPGTFADGPSLKSYLGGHERYRTLVTEGLEWKTCARPGERDWEDMHDGAGLCLTRAGRVLRVAGWAARTFRTCRGRLHRSFWCDATAPTG